MAKVSAAILIYDIRGFTAASKKLPPGELGRFATAAHRSILELFSANPPTFVKNLGDGHLLIWETEEEPQQQLVQFIVDTAAKARAVFPAFVAGHLQEPENSGQKLPTRVGIGVVVGEVSKSDDYYGVAVNLAARLQNMSRPEGLALDHRTFEKLGNRDELIKRGFRKARVELKGLGTTTVWVDRPFSWARVLRTALPYFIAIMIPVIYVLLADAGLSVPGKADIQRWLDEREWSIARRGQLDQQVRQIADRDRRAVADALLNARLEHGMIAVDLRDFKAIPTDIWGTSQAITGLLKTPHLTPDTKRDLLKVYDHAFSPQMFIEGYGWLAHADGSFTEAEPGLWTIAALSVALGTPDLVSGEHRTRLEKYLARAQKAVMIYRPRDTGGWNIFPNQKNLDYYSPYSTTLALLALLEVRAAGLPWEGSVEKRDALLKSTAEFLIKLFEEKDGRFGWRRTAERADPISDGLTLQIFAELLRAEMEAGITLPPRILEEIPKQLGALYAANLDKAYDMGEFSIRFTNHKGQDDLRNEGINFLWHPWAVNAAALWLQRAQRVPAQRADMVAVRRAMGYLVVDMSNRKRAEATGGMSFVAGEALYGLSAIPTP
jgi:class 3 adenylate cyclase